MNSWTQNPHTCSIHDALNLNQITGVLPANGHLRVQNFLDSQLAGELYKHLRDDVSWRALVMADEELLGTAFGNHAGNSPEDESRILALAHRGSRNGFAYRYDADKIFSEDATDCEEQEGGIRGDVLCYLDHSLNGSAFIDILKVITQCPKVRRVSIQATRFRPGHFATFHAGTWSGDATRKRRGGFFLDLTPDWRPDWGGALTFRADENGATTGFLPCFNTLDLLSFPLGHWITAVAPFADAPRFTIAGRIYCE